jgi:hypothetical protein
MNLAARRMMGGALALASVSLLAAACGGSDNTTSNPTPSPGTTGKAGTTVAPGTTRVPSTEASTTSSESSTSSSSSSSSSSTSSSSTSSSSSSTSTTSQGTTIQSFTITPTAITCSADGKPNATMSWVVVPSTVAISFAVDGAGSGAAQAGYTTSMSNQPLPQNFVCDGNPHRVTLMASSSAGTVSKDVLVTTTKSSGGGGGGVS